MIEFIWLNALILSNIPIMMMYQQHLGSFKETGTLRAASHLFLSPTLSFFPSKAVLQSALSVH